MWVSAGGTHLQLGELWEGPGVGHHATQLVGGEAEQLRLLEAARPHGHHACQAAAKLISVTSLGADTALAACSHTAVASRCSKVGRLPG